MLILPAFWQLSIRLRNGLRGGAGIHLSGLGNLARQLTSLELSLPTGWGEKAGREETEREVGQTGPALGQASSQVLSGITPESRSQLAKSMTTGGSQFC